MIVLNKRPDGESLFAAATRIAGEVTEWKPDKLDKLFGDLGKKGQLMIKAFAKKRGLKLHYHPKSWTFRARSGEKVAMPAGYFAVVNGVLEKICIEF